MLTLAKGNGEDYRPAALGEAKRLEATYGPPEGGTTNRAGHPDVKTLNLIQFGQVYWSDLKAAYGTKGHWPPKPENPR